MRSVLYVALGGALGAVARYGLALATAPWMARGVPVGTWAANALGCLLIGLALPLAGGDRGRTFLLVGLLGSFTTFSTFSADTVVLWEAGRPGLAAANAVGSVVVGLAFVALGLGLGRHLAASG